jgi:hypothetical protein
LDKIRNKMRRKAGRSFTVLMKAQNYDYQLKKSRGDSNAPNV